MREINFKGTKIACRFLILAVPVVLPTSTVWNWHVRVSPQRLLGPFLSSDAVDGPVLVTGSAAQAECLFSDSYFVFLNKKERRKKRKRA